MIVVVGLEDVGGVECLDPVHHHAAPAASDDANRQTLIVVLPGRDVIERGFGEEAGPSIDLCIIECMGVIADQAGDLIVGRRVDRLRCNFSDLII